MDISSSSLEGKVAIVTGGKTGIGRATALAFAEAGADVAVCSRTDKGGELGTVADEIGKLGRRALAIKTDVSHKADVEDMVKRTVAELGDIDILVNNAGIVTLRPSLLETEEEVWDELFDVNLKGCYLCCQAVGRIMIEQKKGSIINISSIAGFEVAAPQSAYGVSKSGIILLTKVLAKELASHNIRVNAIAPGWVRTRMNEYVWSDPEALRQLSTEIPLGRMAEPREIANVALFLASDASSYITGHTIIADGGSMA